MPKEKLINAVSTGLPRLDSSFPLIPTWVVNAAPEISAIKTAEQRTIGVAQLKGTPVSTAVKKFIEVLAN